MVNPAMAITKHCNLFYLKAGAMGLSRTDGGQFALLGGRRCLALVNLAQDPHTVIKRSGANFNNILQEPFLYDSVLHSISLITVWLCNFWCKKIGTKAARKMLVQLLQFGDSNGTSRQSDGHLITTTSRPCQSMTALNLFTLNKVRGHFLSKGPFK
jgi:hypothetical protein